VRTSPVDRTGHGRWPLRDDPADPWAIDWPDDDLGLADRRSAWWASQPDDATHRRAARALQDHLDAIHRGVEPLEPPRLGALAEAAGVNLDLRHDTRPVVEGPWRASEAFLARLALDHVPHAGLLGPDMVLGPWVEALDPRQDRRTLQLALAQWAPGHTSQRPPVQALHTARPIPPIDVRAAARAVADAPLLPWRAHPAGEGSRLVPRLPLAAHRLPDHPVPLHHAAGIAPLRDGATVLCRAVRAGGRWSAWAPLVLPHDPPDATVRAWLLPILVRVRLRRRRATVEDVLRGHGHDLARAAHLDAWAHLPPP
jgi:hypothetical protein